MKLLPLLMAFMCLLLANPAGAQVQKQQPYLKSPKDPFNNKQISGFYLSALQKAQNNNPGISLAKNYAALPLPFFCNLESRLHRRANVWIKLRTGNDESYQRLISPAR